MNKPKINEKNPRSMKETNSNERNQRSMKETAKDQ
jgi:hypothetical protein